MNGELLRYSKDNKHFCTFDWETDGLSLNFDICRPYQVGILNATGDKIESEHDILIKWPNRTFNFKEDIVKRLFKTTVADLNRRIDENGVSHEKAFEPIYDSLENADYILGLNILGFDLYLIYEFYKLMGKDPSHLTAKILDVHLLAKGLKLGIAYKPSESITEYQFKLLNKRAKGVKTGLATLAKEYEVPWDEFHAHDGLYDVQTTWRIFKKMLFQIEI